MNDCSVAHTQGELSDQKQLHATCEVVKGKDKDVMCNLTQSDSDYQVQMLCTSAEFAGFQGAQNSWGIGLNKESVCASDHDAFYTWAPTGTCGRRARSFTSHDSNGNQVSLAMDRVSKY
jgi:hypothetical protein